MCMHVAGAAAIAAAGNICQYNRGWKHFCRKTAQPFVPSILSLPCRSFLWLLDYISFFFLFNSGIPTDTAQVTSLSQLNGFKMSPVPSTVLFSVRTGCALRLRLLSSHFCFLSEYRTVFFIFKSKYFFFKSLEFQNNFSLICKNYFEQTTCYFKMKLCWK